MGLGGGDAGAGAAGGGGSQGQTRIAKEFLNYLEGMLVFKGYVWRVFEGYVGVFFETRFTLD